MINDKCRQCGQAFTEGADGYCHDCLAQAQEDMLSRWNDLSKDTEQDGS